MNKSYKIMTAYAWMLAAFVLLTIGMISVAKREQPPVVISLELPVVESTPYRPTPIDPPFTWIAPITEPAGADL